MKRILKKLLSKLFVYYYSYSSNIRLLENRCKVNGFCKFNGNEKFGVNVNFNGCYIYGVGEVNFGDNFHSGKNLIIFTSYHNYNGVSIPYDKSLINKDVTIGDNVWIGMNVTILGGVTIGEGSIIQAGSVVSSNIDALSIAGGNPARKFKTRDSLHYYECKSKKQFF